MPGQLVIAIGRNGASLVVQMVKNLPAMQGIWVQLLGQEDPLVKGMATHFNILAWRIPWTEEPGGLHIVHRGAKNQTRLKATNTFTGRKERDKKL